MLLAAVAVLALTSGQAITQEKKTLAVVVKGLDNPFFTVLGNGCAKWNENNPTSEYTCLYTGPALSSDEAGEVQLVATARSSAVSQSPWLELWKDDVVERIDVPPFTVAEVQRWLVGELGGQVSLDTVRRGSVCAATRPGRRRPARSCPAS